MCCPTHWYSAGHPNHSTLLAILHSSWRPMPAYHIQSEGLLVKGTKKKKQGRGRGGPDKGEHEAM